MDVSEDGEDQMYMTHEVPSAVVEGGGKGAQDGHLIGKNSSLEPRSDATSETRNPENDGDKSPGAITKGNHSDSESGTKQPVARP